MYCIYSYILVMWLKTANNILIVKLFNKNVGRSIKENWQLIETALSKTPPNPPISWWYKQVVCLLGGHVAKKRLRISSSSFLNVVSVREISLRKDFCLCNYGLHSGQCFQQDQAQQTFPHFFIKYWQIVGALCTYWLWFGNQAL